MLINLYIENYVLFDKQNLSFKDGFSALTGDTGAGKSLIIDALGYLTGDRLNVDIIKNKEKNTFIEGNFEFKNQRTLNLLTESGFDFEDVYIVSREITPEGRSISRLNQRSVTLGFIKDVFESELDIHSQRDTQYLLNKNIHLNLLDSFAEHPDLLKQVKSAYNEYFEIKNEIKRLKETVFNPDEIEYTKIQIEEIIKIDPSHEEIDTLNTRLKEINNFEEIYTSISTSNNLLSKNQGIIEQLFEAKEFLRKIDDYSDYSEVASRMNSVYVEIVDLSHEIAGFLSTLEFDEFELNQIESRLFEINRLLKKHGGSLETLERRLKVMQNNVEQFESKEIVLQDLNNQLQAKLQDYNQKALLLRDSRKHSIKSLEKAIIENLSDLHLEDANFKVSLLDKEVSKSGIDDVEFLVAMNKGSTLQPLIKVASGGELSRLMLGLKVIFSKLFGISTVIFDEIDAGVSGAIATAIGVKMYQLSKTSQVFAVTHLAQVAACSNNHYHVEKDSDGLFTSTSVKNMDINEKIEKLALMATGSSSEASLNAASELYYNSQKLVNDIDG
ncbi:MAG: DNA repair protein RecN [Erysipelothrix sp.]|nr:DNA repair protein RecN [Erysipelothrix sp.]